MRQVGKGVDTDSWDMDLEALQVEVRKKLADLNVTELTTIAGELSLTIPPGKLGKQSAIYNIVGMHLMSEDVEGEGDIQSKFSKNY